MKSMKNVNDHKKYYGHLSYDEVHEEFDFTNTLRQNNLLKDFYDGQDLFKKRNYEKALPFFIRIHQILPNLKPVLQIMVQTYWGMAQYEKSLECFDKLIQLHTGDIRYVMAKAHYLDILDRYDECLKLCDETLKEFPNTTDILTKKVDILINRNDFKIAHDLNNKILTLNKDDPIANLNRLKILINNNQIDEFKEIIEELIKKSTQVEKQILHKISELIVESKEEEALLLIDREIYNKKKYENKQRFISKISYFMNIKDYEKAVKECNEAIKRDPNDLDFQIRKIYPLCKNQEYNKASNCVEHILSIDPKNIKALNGKGNVFFYQKQYNEAIKWFDKAIEINNKFAESYYNKACSYALMNNREKALALLKQSIKLDPYYKIWSKKDKDMEWLWNDPEFIAITEK